ncbi:MAG: rod shape-determining protein MreC [Candidatus Eisenbacteria bacterium]|nr:rod shape-determining protein MreC [Candidatus Eisenbacteria bacterium]
MASATSLFDRKRETTVLLVLIFLSFTLMAADQGGRLRTARALRVFVLGPFEMTGSFVSTVLELKRENEQLADLAVKASVEKELLLEENLRKQSGMDMKEFAHSSGLDLVLARVVARSTERFASTLTIDKGKKDGLTPEMPVLSSDGVAGKLGQVFGQYSIVDLITSGRCSVAARLRRTRVHGIVSWESSVGALKMKYVPVGEDVREGDEVFSSGMGGVFPGGLKLGTVRKVGVAEDTFLKDIVVEPSVRIARLEEVTVLRSSKQMGSLLKVFTESERGPAGSSRMSKASEY